MDVVGPGPDVGIVRGAALLTASWTGVPDDDPSGVHCLPYAVQPGVGPVVAVGDRVLDLGAAARALLPQRAALLGAPSLDPLLAAGPAVWAEVRAALQEWLTDERHADVVAPLLRPRDDAALALAFAVADYVDFYASEHHAARVGRIFRPGQPPLLPNWKHLPVGYHGRAGSVVVSGTPVRRPRGVLREADGAVAFAPTRQLDLEAEVGFVVGAPSRPGRPVPLEAVADHVFGACLVDDWSARDVQAFEYVPLGPFLGKAFATSVSPWVVPLAALEGARVAPPPRDPRPLPHLDDAGLPPYGLDLRLEVEVAGEVVARPPYATTYWTVAQQVAHLTSGGAALRTGDLLASGTVSGPRLDEAGCLLELTSAGREPLLLTGGRELRWLEDGDEVVVRGEARCADGRRVGLGEVRGRVLGADAEGA